MTPKYTVTEYVEDNGQLFQVMRPINAKTCFPICKDGRGDDAF